MKAKLLPLFLVLPATAPANIVISELDLATSQVELVNIGGSALDLTAYRWCNRVNGSPFYPGVSAATINAGLSTSTGLVVLPGQIVTFNLTSAFLPAAGGELGLYLPTGSFGARSAMVDYLNYGSSTGFRDAAADDPPAIWETNASINISAMVAGETIQLKLGTPGNSVNDYEIAPATPGVAQSLAPVEIGIASSGFADADTFFIEFTYNGSGTLKVTESTTLASAFTDVSTRTTVSTPNPGRFEFDITGNALFFRIEEE